MQLVLLEGVTSKGLTTSLTTLLTGSLEEEEGTKFVEWGLGTDMLSIKPKPVLSKGDF